MADQARNSVNCQKNAGFRSKTVRLPRKTVLTVTERPKVVCRHIVFAKTEGYGDTPLNCAVVTGATPDLFEVDRAI